MFHCRVSSVSNMDINFVFCFIICALWVFFFLIDRSLVILAVHKKYLKEMSKYLFKWEYFSFPLREFFHFQWKCSFELKRKPLGRKRLFNSSVCLCLSAQKIIENSCNSIATIRNNYISSDKFKRTYEKQTIVMYAWQIELNWNYHTLFITNNCRISINNI